MLAVALIVVGGSGSNSWRSRCPRVIDGTTADAKSRGVQWPRLMVAKRCGEQHMGVSQTCVL